MTAVTWTGDESGLVPVSVLRAPKGPALRVSASMEAMPQTRSGLEESDEEVFVNWSAGDSFKAQFIGRDGQLYDTEFVTDSGGKSADFTTMNLLDGEDYICLYPGYSDAFVDEVSGKRVFGMTVPEGQSAVAGGIADGVNLSFALSSRISEGTGLVFHNIPSLIRFSLSGDVAGFVRKVTLKASYDVSGYKYVTDDQGIPIAYSSSSGKVLHSNSVILEGTFIPGENYYIAVWPGVTDGFEMTFEAEDGVYTTLKSSEKISFSRLLISDLGTIDLGDAFMDGSAPMVICTFNIRQANPKDTLADGTDVSWEVRKPSVKGFLDSVKPDLVGLQEVCREQAEWFASYSPDYGYYDVSMDGGIGTSLSEQEKGPHGGIGVLYRKDRFELVSADFFWLDQDIHSLPEWHWVWAMVDGKPERKGVFGAWNSGARRITLSVMFKDKYHRNTLIYFFPTHYDNFSVDARRNSAELMVAQMKEICQVDDLKEGNAVVFHLGDMNAVSESDSGSLLESLNDNMNYARTAVPGPDIDIGTYNGYRRSHNTWHIIDHIYYGGKTVKPIGYKVYRTSYGVPFISDHFPVLFNWEYQ